MRKCSNKHCESQRTRVFYLHGRDGFVTYKRTQVLSTCTLGPRWVSVGLIQGLCRPRKPTITISFQSAPLVYCTLFYYLFTMSNNCDLIDKPNVYPHSSHNNLINITVEEHDYVSNQTLELTTQHHISNIKVFLGKFYKLGHLFCGVWRMEQCYVECNWLLSFPLCFFKFFLVWLCFMSIKN